MPDQPLQPFAPPTALLSHLPALSTGLFVEWFLFGVFAVWVLYTLVALYHWFTYSHCSWVAFPAIGAHLFISIALMSYILSGNGFFLTSYLP